MYACCSAHTKEHTLDVHTHLVFLNFLLAAICGACVGAWFLPLPTFKLLLCLAPLAVDPPSKRAISLIFSALLSGLGLLKPNLNSAVLLQDLDLFYHVWTSMRVRD